MKAKKYYEQIGCSYQSLLKLDIRVLKNLLTIYYRVPGEKVEYFRALNIVNEILFNKGEESFRGDDSKFLERAGYMYRHGHEVKKKYQKAKQYYEMAIRQGNASVMCDLGTLYLQGGYGLKRDRDKGEQLLSEASKKGYHVKITNSIEDFATPRRSK